MKKILSLAVLSLFLISCSGPAVELGSFNFNLPSSWEMQNQSTNLLEVAYEQGGESFPMSVGFQESSAMEATDMSFEIRPALQIYELGKCSGFICYGLVTEAASGIVTFSDNGNTSSLSQYDPAESIMKFMRSVK